MPPPFTSARCSNAGGGSVWLPGEFETAARVDAKQHVADGVRGPDAARARWPTAAALGTRLARRKKLNRRRDAAVLAGAVTSEDRHNWRLGILRDPNGSGGIPLMCMTGYRSATSSVSAGPGAISAGPFRRATSSSQGGSASPRSCRWRAPSKPCRSGLAARVRRPAAATTAFLDELALDGDWIMKWPQDEKGLLDLDGLLGRPRPDTKGLSSRTRAAAQRCRAALRLVAQGLATRRALRGQTAHRAWCCRKHLKVTSRGATSPSPFQPTSLS